MALALGHPVGQPLDTGLQAFIDREQSGIWPLAML